MSFTSQAQRFRHIASGRLGNVRHGLEMVTGGNGKSGFVSPPVRRYVADHTSAADRVLADLAVETSLLGDAAEMQVPAEQGALLTILTASLAPARAVEIGTFTGYSALCIARGLAPGGQLLCLDVNDEWTSIARRYWARAEVDDRIELRLGPAADSLARLPAQPTFDLAFIDADKVSYLEYFELLVPRMNPNGLIIADNVLQYGRVVQEDATHPSVLAIRRFNEVVAHDPRVQAVMLPVADGLTIARRLPDPAAEA